MVQEINASPLPSSVPEPKKKNNHKFIFLYSLIILVFLALASAGTFFFIKVTNAEKLIAKRPKITNVLGSSVLEFSKELKDGENGSFLVVSNTPASSGTHVPRSTGSFFRIKDGSIYTVFDIDVNFVNQEVAKIAQKRKDLTNPIPLVASTEYQLDQKGFLSALTMPLNTFIEELIISNSRMADTEENKKLIQSCQEYLKQSDASLTEFIQGLKPAYVYNATTEKNTWTIDLTEFSTNIAKQAQENCGKTIVSNGTEMFDKNYMNRLEIEDESRNRVGSLNFWQIVGTDPSKVRTKVLSISLTNLNKSSTPQFQGKPISLFGSSTTSYLLAVNQCKGLPIITSVFAASFSYTIASSKFYYGPTFLDNTYVCTEDEAKRAGFHKNPLDAKYITYAPTIDFDLLIPKWLSSRFVKIERRVNSDPAVFYTIMNTTMESDGSHTPELDIVQFKKPDFLQFPTSCPADTPEKKYAEKCSLYTTTPKGRKLYISSANNNEVRQYFYILIGNTYVVIRKGGWTNTAQSIMPDEELVSLVDSLSKASTGEMKTITIEKVAKKISD